jgi:hypothetical protein
LSSGKDEERLWAVLGAKRVVARGEMDVLPSESLDLVHVLRDAGKFV